MGDYIAAAFRQVCKDAVKAVAHYVVLVQRTTWYGGPEEGGWYGHDRIVVEYERYATKEMAEKVKAEVEKVAKEMTEDAKRHFGQRCLEETEWCEARGLDADYLSDPGGPDEFYVELAEFLPESYYQDRHWE